MITWLDKIDGLDLGDPQKNVNAADMNQIKNQHNALETNVPVQIASAVNGVLGGAPGNLDTLGELAQAINNDPNFYATLVALLDFKAPLNSPTFTGTVGGITKTMVGLSNVDNTSNATERAATATLTNKTLTSPVINSPTGIVKGDVGLGNVDNTSDATKLAAVLAMFVYGEIPSGTINGINDDFTIANANPSKVALYSDGIRTDPANFSITGTALTITNLLVIPTNSLLIDYIK